MNRVTPVVAAVTSLISVRTLIPCINPETACHMIETCDPAMVCRDNLMKLGLIIGTVTAGMIAAQKMAQRYLIPSQSKWQLPELFHPRDGRTIENSRKIRNKLVKERKAAFTQGQLQEQKNSNLAWVRAADHKTEHFSSNMILINGKIIGVAHDQGVIRKTMEDRSLAVSGVVKIRNQSKTYELYAIFDGHGGVETAEFLQKNLERWILNELEEMKALNDTTIWNALKMACVKCDAECKTTIMKRSGSTAIIAFLINGDLWIVNVGDSRAIWRKANGEVIQLSEDAKPTDSRYVKSIKKRGGYILRKRVNSSLAIARSFNNHHLLAVNGMKTYCISARPKIVKISKEELGNGKGHLILCSEGITDVASSQNIGDLIGAYEWYKDSKILAEQIVTTSLLYGSKDNLSSMVIPL